MADIVFNVAKGAAAEKVADASTSVGILLLKVVEADGTLQDYDTLAAILAGANTECDFTNYARKTGLTGTVTVDDTNNRVDIDVADQTWTAAGGTLDNSVVKLITFLEEAAADATRIPLTAHDFVVTTNGGDVTAQIATAGFYRAA